MEDGQRTVVLIEVKLSDEEFTHCYGRRSHGNRRNDDIHAYCGPSEIETRTIESRKAQAVRPGENGR